MTEHHRSWLRLDNAAKLYPAVRSRKWSNVFRLSVTLEKPVVPEVLQAALTVTIARFPSMAMRIRSGFFWYFLDRIRQTPHIQPEAHSPCTPMTRKEIHTCAFRVLYYENRIAVEFFHSLTDGNGALVFLKTLVAEYLLQAEHAAIPFRHGVLDRTETPALQETEDSFLKYGGKVSESRREASAYRIRGTREREGVRHIVTGIIPLASVLPVAKSYQVSLTAFLVSVMIYSIAQMQNRTCPVKHRQKAVKVLIPVNLRNYFSSTSLRNFVLYITPGIEANMGDFTLEEIISSVHHQMKFNLTKKRMQARITANVKMERNKFLKALPLFLKNIGMKIAFSLVGEKKSCITMSNLGAVRLPSAMQPYVRRFDFTLGMQATCPNNCGLISYGDFLYINMIRNIRESELERLFFSNLVALGVAVEVESNHA